MKRYILTAAAILLVAPAGYPSDFPALQPGVKELRAEAGKLDVGECTVFFEDQKQCRIGADEIECARDRCVWNFGQTVGKGIYVAVAGSELGRKLLAHRRIDVPDREQGYALVVDADGAAIVGRDSVGALYGCVTFRQLAAGGRAPFCRIRDWPDILERGGVSAGRGLWPQTKGKKPADRIEEFKRTVDELMRHKINGITDIFHAWSDSPSLDVYREVLAYARERGIRTTFSWVWTCLWNNSNCPDGTTPATWPCVSEVRGYGDLYYCWADDAQMEAAADRRIDSIVKYGLEDPVVQLHPVDACAVEDPEHWSKRCAKCRARWKDDERWKASANLLNIWRRAFNKRLPKASFICPVVPYWISWLERPPEKRDAVWRRNVTDYWVKLDAALDDKDMAFESWIASKASFDEYRRLIPHRTVRFTDNYPLCPGLILTCRRKIGTMYEPCGRTGYHMTGTDINACWESCLLAAEYAWNVNAPGAEPYDGNVYWHPVQDTSGPEIVMTNVLPRICRTFWGDAVAPHMCKVMSSGVLPKYLKDPAAAVRSWNFWLRDARYDPEQARLFRMREGKTAFEFTDSLDFRRRQLDAARKCASALKAARPLIGSLDHFKQNYFRSMADAAPEWVERASAIVAQAEIESAFERRDVAKAREIAGKAAAELSKGESRSKLERMVEVLGARSDDPQVPPKDGFAGKSAPEPCRWKKAEMWRGERFIDSPLVLNRRNIRIEKGTRIVFRGKGSLRIENGQLCAQGAEFIGNGVLTNCWPISVSGGKTEFVNCRFDGLAMENTGRERWFHGGIQLTSTDARVVGCRFVNSRSLSFVNCRNVEVADNVFSCLDMGLYFLNSPGSRAERNVFVADSGAKKGIEFANSLRCEVIHNRFDGLATGVFARTGASYVIIAGNVFEKCTKPYRAVESKGIIVVD